MTISIIVIPSVIHQGNDTHVPNVTFIPFCEQRRARSEHSRPPHSPTEGLITNQVLLFGEGAPACEQKSNVLFGGVGGGGGNNNDGDGKCNLIPLIRLPLSPPLTGKH